MRAPICRFKLGSRLEKIDFKRYNVSIKIRLVPVLRGIFTCRTKRIECKTGFQRNGIHVRYIYTLSLWSIIFLNSACVSGPPALAQGGCGAKAAFSITSPANGDAVGMIPTVQGTFGTPGAEILVVVHPLADGADQEFWLQRPTSRVQSDCSWNVTIHVGDPGTHSEKFEIEAFEYAQAAPSQPTLSSWPTADAHSNMITVLRK